MADEISDRKSPGFWFYTADFERDMQILPLAAQGLWIRMMCWASDNEEHRGFLELPTGQPMTDLDIAHRVGKPIKEVRAAIEAMRRMGTFSEDARGCIFSRRMARDTHISEVRRQAASKRATLIERAKTGEFAPAKHPAKPEQKPTVTASASVSVSDSLVEPPKPPAPLALALVVSKNGNGHHRKSGKRTSEEIRKALGDERLPWWDAFWAVFPCRESPTQGMDAFERRVHTRELAIELFHGAQRYAKQFEADPTMRLKYAQGWINAERWKDENRVAVNGRPPGKALSFTESVTRAMERRVNAGMEPI